MYSDSICFPTYIQAVQYLLRKHDIRGGKNAKLDLQEFRGVLEDVEKARNKTKGIDEDDAKKKGVRTLDDDDVE